MAFRIRIHPEAHSEWDSSIDWYNNQSQELGKIFDAASESTIRRILEKPELFPPYKKGFRKAGFAVFPYNIIYKIEGDYSYPISIA